MANAYTVTITNIATDGTNIYVDVSVCDGVHTMPPMRVTFPSGTAAATIQAYVQTIANNQPTLAGDVANLVNTTVVGA